MVNTGVYVFEPGIFEHIPAHTFYDFGKQVFPELQRAGAAFYGYDAGRAYWCDIGTLDEYRRGTNDILAGVFTIPGARGSTHTRRSKATSGSARARSSKPGRR